MRRPTPLISPTPLKPPLLWALAAALLLIGVSLCRGQTADATQTPAAKAGAVMNLVKNTEWPANAFASAESPVVIAVLGDGEEIADALRKTASGQRVRGRTVEVRRLSGPKQSTDNDLSELLRQARLAHVLFVCGSERARAAAIVQGLGNADVLTVSDMDGFTESGAMVGLTVRDDRLAVDTNAEKIQSTRLKVAPQLLQAKEVDRASAVKAGMVLNFVRYTEWPASAFTAADSPIVIAVLGDGEEIADALRQTVSGQHVRGRPVEVRRLASPKQPTADGLSETLRQARAAHVLFVCESERDRLGALLQGLGNADVLTVGDMDGFAEKGGMLGLTIRRKKIAVDANTEKIQATQLKVSSQLLRLAQTVKSRGQ